MADWDTRLVVTYDDGTGEVEISPITAFVPQFSFNTEALHSIEDTHLGVVTSPKALTFSLTVLAIGDVAARLTKLAMDGTRFSIALKEKTGDDWGYKAVVMSECVITQATPSSPTIQGAPTATFSGFSLAATADTKAVGTGTAP